MSVASDIISVLLIYMIIGILWMLAEKLFYGKVTPRLLDDAVAIILAVSVFMNFN